MIRLLPTLYVAFAVVAFGTGIACIVALSMRRKSVAKTYARACLFACGGLAIAAVSLAKYSEHLSRRISELPFQISREQVRQALGAPTERIEPAIGAGMQPDTNAAIWYYQIKMWPFKQEHHMEFYRDQLLAK